MRHAYYGVLQKSTTDGYTCLHHALGKKCQHDHVFGPSEKLSIALTNHVVIGHIVNLAWIALQKTELPANELECIGLEIDSMRSFAVLAGKELLHYTKHLARGWWQETARQELKRWIASSDGVKGIFN
jgi:hypothetical protein